MHDLTTARGAEPTVTAAKPFPRIWPSLGWIILYFALQIIITAVIIGVAIAMRHASAGAAGQTPNIDPASMTKDGVLIMWGLVASAVIQLWLMWLYLRKDNRMQKLGLTHLGSLSWVRTMAISVVALIAATGFNHLYATYIIPGMPMQDDMAKLLASIPRTPLNISMGFLAIAGAAPLIEEVLFRGLLQRSFAHKMPAWAAIMLSAFAFSLVHLQPYAIPALMAIGVAFGYIYHKTGSLRVTILLHMINNALALILTQAV
jgi:membrane protease YdiL (CAAX protease family)